jgi:hypothetical protein
MTYSLTVLIGLIVVYIGMFLVKQDICEAIDRLTAEIRKMNNKEEDEE